MNKKTDELTEVKRQLDLERKINYYLNIGIDAINKTLELREIAVKENEKMKPVYSSNILKIVHKSG